ncbi:uncharacterized protein LOC111275500 [Durio zibethinus]|uniref:Uncharacterized protein LOC111275500 n=1 Tax=Durio zibethinus TaxID=66656 RepID=A0A6P5WKW5_DURZI|nr:uncharacterized protein LOC111275500 [Durio zibethinus]
MASDAEVAVFIDTNLGTHLAMAVSPDITVADFQVYQLQKTIIFITLQALLIIFILPKFLQEKSSLSLHCIENYHFPRFCLEILFPGSCFSHSYTLWSWESNATQILVIWDHKASKQLYYLQILMNKLRLLLSIQRFVIMIASSNCSTSSFLHVPALLYLLKPLISAKILSVGELERIHYSCFRELGEIKVNALMVKRTSHFYHLTSSMPIKYAFCHQERGWFLHIQARTLKASDWSCLSNFAATEVEDLKCDGNQRTNPLVQNIGQEAMISSDATEWNSCLINKNPCNISSTAISAAGTINRYLLNHSGVSKLTSSPSTGKASQGLPEQQLRTKADNYYSSIQIGASPPFMVRTPSKQSSFLSPAGRTTGIPRDKVICSEVGKRIIVASNKIRISDKQRLITPLSKMRDRKLSCYKNLSRAKFLVFEISDSDD